MEHHYRPSYRDVLYVVRAEEDEHEDAASHLDSLQTSIAAGGDASGLDRQAPRSKEGQQWAFDVISGNIPRDDLLADSSYAAKEAIAARHSSALSADREVVQWQNTGGDEAEGLESMYRSEAEDGFSAALGLARQMNDEDALQQIKGDVEAAFNDWGMDTPKYYLDSDGTPTEALALSPSTRRPDPPPKTPDMAAGLPDFNTGPVKDAKVVGRSEPPSGGFGEAQEVASSLPDGVSLNSSGYAGKYKRR